MMRLPQSSPWLGRLPAFTAGFLACAVSLGAQSRRTAASSTGFFKDPNGVRLATLQRGAAYDAGRTNGAWLEVTVEGYVWAQSTQPTSRDGFDLVVTADGGEVLRASPNGAIVARLAEGTLLDRMGTRGKWYRVKRTGWAARGGFVDPREPREVTSAAGRTGPPLAATSSPDSTRSGAPDSTARPSSPPADSVVATEHGTVRRGAELATLPDGQRIALLPNGGTVDVVERSHDWVKVRLEGWVRQSDLASVTAPGPLITGAMIRDDPAKYVGQSIDWRLNFLALEEADELRPEIAKGQPYLLTRGPLPEAGFVYVLVNRDQLAVARGLRPLDEIRVQGIIRAGRTRYLPTPVVELTRLVTH